MFAHEKPARSIEHARDQSRTRYLWIVDYLSDYSKFDFLWEPVPWEAAQCHAWPSQWQVEGGTFLVPKVGFTDVNREHEIVPKHVSVFKVLIDHLDNSTLELESVRTVRFFESYLATLRRIANSAQEEYLWICSSVCDYSNFDFTWHPDPWQTQMLHVFASEDQKFGDTF